MDPSRRSQLVWLAEVPFRGIPHRQSRLAKLLSDRFDTLYVEPPPPLRPPSLVLTQHDRVTVAQAAPLVNARPPVLRQLLSLRVVRSAASWLAAAQVALASRRASSGFEFGDTAVVCSNVYLVDAALAMRPAALIVDICDDPRHYPGEPSWTHELLVRALRAADVVTTSSRALEREMRELGAREVRYIPNGVYASALQIHEPRNSDVIGFVGYLGPWIDLALLETLVDALPDRQLVLVGQIDPGMADAFARLGSRQNVRLAGPVPERDVPSTIASFGVGIIPLAVTPYTRAVNPNKLYEYAAQDLPIVTTAFSPDVEQFGEAVVVCPSQAEFVKAVKDAISGPRGGSTRWIAESHTWEAIADQFAETIVEAMSARGGADGALKTGAQGHV